MAYFEMSGTMIPMGGADGPESLRLASGGASLLAIAISFYVHRWGGNFFVPSLQTSRHGKSQHILPNLRT
jgi:hypothetical protein